MQPPNLRHLDDEMNPNQKARLINENPKIYGTFAEIGAGQEVARYFFKAGRASQTVAKSISAYDMSFSDEIYGKSPEERYVSRARLLRMLQKEYQLLERRLKHRAHESLFFVLATTVATGPLVRGKQPHGWMGLRFQREPGGPTMDLHLHLILQDRYRHLQQECLGILGVNLIYGVFFELESEAQFIRSLFSQIKREQLTLEVIHFLCPQPPVDSPASTGLEDAKNQPPQSLALCAIDVKERELRLNLELLKNQRTSAIYVNKNQNVDALSEVFFDKSLTYFRKKVLWKVPLENPGQHDGSLHLAAPQEIAEIISHPSDRRPSLVELPLPPLALNIPTEQLTKKLLSFFKENDLKNFHLVFSDGRGALELLQFLRLFTTQPFFYELTEVDFWEWFLRWEDENLAGGVWEGIGRLFAHDSKLRITPPTLRKDKLQTRKDFQESQIIEKSFQRFEIILQTIKELHKI